MFDLFQICDHCNSTPFFFSSDWNSPSSSSSIAYHSRCDIFSPVKMHTTNLLLHQRTIPPGAGGSNHLKYGLCRYFYNRGSGSPFAWESLPQAESEKVHWPYQYNYPRLCWDAGRDDNIQSPPNHGMVLPGVRLPDFPATFCRSSRVISCSRMVYSASILRDSLI